MHISLCIICVPSWVGKKINKLGIFREYEFEGAKKRCLHYSERDEERRIEGIKRLKLFMFIFWFVVGIKK